MLAADGSRPGHRWVYRPSPVGARRQPELDHARVTVTDMDSHAES